MIYRPISSIVYSPLKRPIEGDAGSMLTLPPYGLLSYIPLPNDGADYRLPETDAVRAATGWISGTANFWFDADGAAIKHGAAAILELAGINTSNIWFTVAKGLAIYSADISDSIIRRIAGYYRLPVPSPETYYLLFNEQRILFAGNPMVINYG